ncbi:MFS family permease [Rhizobium tibeticum]|nr:MFS family permease [Rhizobium tibeticum]
MDSVQYRQESVLRHPGYLNFAASRVLSSLAFQSIAVAMGWMIYDQTHSAFALGLVGLCQFLPMVMLTFVVGQVADHFDRRRIGLICQLVEGVTALFLGLAAWQGILSASGILIAVAILGAAQAFERPTMAALLPTVVPASLLQNSIATTTSMMQTALVIGPSFGGCSMVSMKWRRLSSRSSCSS